jgi:hypothetical protein
MKNSEPWYGVRLIYRMTGCSRQSYEERITIVRARSGDDAILQAERASKEYEDETVKYIGYAMAFNIVDENGPALGPGREVFSLIRYSELEPGEYLDHFHDTGNECARGVGEGRLEQRP